MVKSDGTNGHILTPIAVYGDHAYILESNVHNVNGRKTDIAKMPLEKLRNDYTTIYRLKPSDDYKRGVIKNKDEQAEALKIYLKYFKKNPEALAELGFKQDVTYNKAGKVSGTGENSELFEMLKETFPEEAESETVQGE